MPKEYFLELVSARVAPADRSYRDGILLGDGKTEPFLVERSWSGPAGNYVEQWSIRRGLSEVLHRPPAGLIRVRGMQSVSTVVDRVDDPVLLESGDYKLVFVVEGHFMGSADIRVEPAGDAAA